MLTPIQFARMAMIGNVRLLPVEIRETFIKAVLDARRSVVEYAGRDTKCPVCEMFGLNSDVIVNSTNAGKRACECRRCTATFTAISDDRISSGQDSDNKQVCESERKRKKSKRKKGNHNV